MNTFKKITLTSAVAFALFAFNACGDDSNSTSASGENSTLSSAVEDDESSSSINGDSSSSVIPGSSSSVVSDSEGSSSSVKGSDTADVSSSSVISDPDRESSSSSVKSSSSSAKSSSSVNSSSSVKSSSSSSAKQSSSSEDQSSSSVQNPWGTSAEWHPFSCNAHGGCLEFTDDRNGRTYKYLKFDGKKCLNYSETGKCISTKDTSIFAMVENLNVGDMVRGFKDQKDDSKIERYCYDNDTLNCHYYGGLYQWAEMMKLPFECNNMSCADSIKPNHQGICPDDWHLLTYDDFFIVVNSNGNQDGVKGVRSTFGFGGSNDTGFSLVGTGVRALRNGVYSFEQLNELTIWYYPREISVDGVIYPNAGHTSRTDTYIYGKDAYNYTKLEGFSVRCVMNE